MSDRSKRKSSKLGTSLEFSLRRGDNRVNLCGLLTPCSIFIYLFIYRGCIETESCSFKKNF